MDDGLSISSLEVLKATLINKWKAASLAVASYRPRSVFSAKSSSSSWKDPEWECLIPPTCSGLTESLPPVGRVWTTAGDRQEAAECMDMKPGESWDRKPAAGSFSSSSARRGQKDLSWLWWSVCVCVMVDQIGVSKPQGCSLIKGSVLQFQAFSHLHVQVSSAVQGSDPHATLYTFKPYWRLKVMWRHFGCNHQR